MTDQDVLATHNDLEMMRRPHLWPKLTLFLKEPSTKQLALLFKTSDGYQFVPETTPFQPDLSNSRFGGEELLQSLIQAGWLVD
jgi:hypothetical protein